jgi:hypothetical protein
MYNRSYGQRRPPTIPQNYSGNAFYRVPENERRPDPPPPPTPPPCDCEECAQVCECENSCECHGKEDCKCEKECCTCQTNEHEKPAESNRPTLPFLGGKLFPRGIGGEELLILALILVASSGEQDNDLIFFLILLLFC